MGDITLIDRVESIFEDKKNKDLFEVTQTSDFDYNGAWLSSLRNNEPDLERNGLNQIRL
jgi:hypothetical protein